MFHNESTLFETTFSCFFQVDASVGTEMGTMTEPDCLGPLEPGTSVTLEGIVWHETDGGKPVQYFFLMVFYQDFLVCFSNPTCPPRSSIGSDSCVPSKTSSYPCLRG